MEMTIHSSDTGDDHQVWMLSIPEMMLERRRYARPVKAGEKS
jgi:hypothetical protein